MSVDPLFFAVVKITTFDDPSTNKICKVGTGFFYRKDNDLFLITNRHVIIEEDKYYLPNVVRLTLHHNAANLKLNSYFDISLYRGSKPLWRQQEPPIADLVAIPINLEEFRRRGFIIRAFESDSLLPKDIQLQVGEDVIIMGYPLGEYYDDVYNLPIVRNGIIASAYLVPYRGNPYFLVDARLHPGTSGSPVLTKSKNAWRDTSGNVLTGGFRFFLLGINSSTWKIQDDEPLGLNTTVFASLIEDLIR